MFLQDPSQVDGAHKREPLQLNTLTRPEPGQRTTQKSTITNKCSYKTQGKLTEHTKEYYYKQMLLQDPRQVDGAHKRVLLLQTNALTKPEASRRSTQKVLLQTNALTRPEQGRRSTQKSTITNKCSYKTRGRSTEHTEEYYYKQMLLQDPRQVDGAHKSTNTNALTRPEPGRRSTQKSTITNKCSYKTRGKSMEHTKSTITNKCSYKTRARSTEHTEEYYYKQMLLQDLSQVEGAHKRVILQTNALTRPEAGRRSTQKSTITNKCSYKTRGKPMEHTKSTITNKCSYKTRARSTEHTEKYYYKQMLLQDLNQVDGAHKRVILLTNALTRPEPGRRSTQKSTITNKCSYKT